MSYKYQLILYFSLVIFEWYLDDYYVQCQSVFGKLLMILHHMLLIFHLFGSLIFGLYELHLVISFCIIGGWKLFGYCMFTRIHNGICNIENKHKFINIVSVLLETLHLDKYYSSAYETYCWGLVCYDLYHLRFPTKL